VTTTEGKTLESYCDRTWHHNPEDFDLNIRGMWLCVDGYC